MEAFATVLQNNFLFTRLVIFILLMALNLLLIGFAAWSIVSASVRDLPVGSIMALLISPLLLGAILSGAAAFFRPKLSTAHVKYELIWTTTLSVLKIIFMLVSTIHRPGCALDQENLSLFVSYVMYLVIGWLITGLLLGYTISLAIASKLHQELYPNLMSSPVHIVPWYQKIDIEKGMVRTSMFFQADLDCEFSCQSPSYEGRFAGVRMHEGPFAVVVAKQAKETAEAAAMQFNSS